MSNVIVPYFSASGFLFTYLLTFYSVYYRDKWQSRSKSLMYAGVFKCTLNRQVHVWNPLAATMVWFDPRWMLGHHVFSILFNVMCYAGRYIYIYLSEWPTWPTWSRCNQCTTLHLSSSQLTSQSLISQEMRKKMAYFMMFFAVFYSWLSYFLNKQTISVAVFQMYECVMFLLLHICLKSVCGRSLIIWCQNNMSR